MVTVITLGWCDEHTHTAYLYHPCMRYYLWSPDIYTYTVRTIDATSFFPQDWQSLQGVECRSKPEGVFGICRIHGSTFDFCLESPTVTWHAQYLRDAILLGKVDITVKSLLQDPIGPSNSQCNVCFDFGFQEHLFVSLVLEQRPQEPTIAHRHFQGSPPQISPQNGSPELLVPIASNMGGLASYAGDFQGSPPQISPQHVSPELIASSMGGASDFQGSPPLHVSPNLHAPFASSMEGVADISSGFATEFQVSPPQISPQHVSSDLHAPIASSMGGVAGTSSGLGSGTEFQGLSPQISPQHFSPDLPVTSSMGNATDFSPNQVVAGILSMGSELQGSLLQVSPQHVSPDLLAIGTSSMGGATKLVEAPSGRKVECGSEWNDIDTSDTGTELETEFSAPTVTVETGPTPSGHLLEEPATTEGQYALLEERNSFEQLPQAHIATSSDLNTEFSMPLELDSSCAVENDEQQRDSEGKASVSPERKPSADSSDEDIHMGLVDVDQTFADENWYGDDDSD